MSKATPPQLPAAPKSESSARRLMEEMTRNIPKIPDFKMPELGRQCLSTNREAPTLTPQEANEYQSASVLMQALAEDALRWKEQLPEQFRPTILAILYGGIQIDVQTLSQVSFHGIRIEGTMNGSPCSLLAHQASVQLLCFAEEITEQSPKRSIGFIWDNNEVEV